MAVLLSRDAILASPVPSEEVDVPEWGGSVRIRAMTFADRAAMLDAINVRAHDVDSYEADQALPEGEREGMERAEHYDETLLRVLFSIVDDQGERLFTLDDYPLFRDLNYPTIARIYAALNALERPRAVDPEALKKSSGTRQKGASSSGSRGNSAKQ